MMRNLLLATAVLLCACAAFEAPVRVEATRPVDEVTTTLRIVEGRPRSIVLEISAVAEPESHLEIYRRVGEADYELYESVKLDERLAGALTDGMQYIDRAPTKGSLTYVAAIVTPERVLESTPYTLQWNAITAPPDHVSGRALSSTTAELDWRGSASSALIFRRDVLKPGDTPKRLATVGPTAGQRFIDHELTPGGVYAYRISAAVEREGWVQFGPPGEELYVTLPDEPASE